MPLETMHEGEPAARGQLQGDGSMAAAAAIVSPIKPHLLPAFKPKQHTTQQNYYFILIT